MRLILGHDEKLAAWAAKHIPNVGDAGFGPCRTIGIASGDRLYAVAVYHNYIPRYGVCELSFAAVTPRWATRETLRTVLGIPFDQYGCRKIYVTIEISNERALKCIQGFGFSKEATLRHHFGHKRHAVVLSMMAHEYRGKWGPVLKEAA